MSGIVISFGWITGMFMAVRIFTVYVLWGVVMADTFLLWFIPIIDEGVRAAAAPATTDFFKKLRRLSIILYFNYCT